MRLSKQVIVLGFLVILLGLAFSNYHPKAGLIWNLQNMKIMFRKEIKEEYYPPVSYPALPSKDDFFQPPGDLREAIERVKKA